MLAEFVGQTPLQWLQEVFEICRDFHRSGRPAVEKLQCRQIVLALAFTHRLRIRVSGADNPLLRLRPPVRMKRLDQSCRAAGCALFPNESSDVVWPQQPDSTIRLSLEQGPVRGQEDHKP